MQGLYHVIENTANQNTGKTLHIDGITPNVPIVHRAYVARLCWPLYFLRRGVK